MDRHQVGCLRARRPVAPVLIDRRRAHILGRCRDWPRDRIQAAARRLFFGQWVGLLPSERRDRSNCRRDGRSNGPGLGRDLRNHDVVRVRIEAGRIGNEPFEEILNAALLVQLPDQRNRVGTVKPGSEDEQRKDAAPDSPAGYGRVGDREVPDLEWRNRRPAVNVACPFFSSS